MAKGQPTDDATVARVRELLAAGVTHKEIAKRCGVGSSTICDIGRRMREPRRLQHRPPRQDFASRCPECGGWVYMPCRACAMREKLLETNNE